MAPHSSTLAWKIPWTEEPGRLQSMGSLWVRHDWATSLSLFTFMHWRRKRQPTPVVLPGESRDGGAWRAAVYEVAQSRTWLKRLSRSTVIYTGFPDGSVVKKKETVTHSSILAWEIPRTGEPGGLQSMTWQESKHTHTHTHMLLEFMCAYQGFCFPYCGKEHIIQDFFFFNL